MLPEKNDYIFGGYFIGPNGTGIQIISRMGVFITASVSHFTYISLSTAYAYWENMAYNPINNNTEYEVIGIGTITANEGNNEFIFYERFLFC